MQPRRKAAIWSNDVGATAADAGGKGRPGPEGVPGTGRKARAKAAAAAAGGDGDSSDDEYTDLPATRSVPSGAECLCPHPISCSLQQPTLNPFHTMAIGLSTWIIRECLDRAKRLSSFSSQASRLLKLAGQLQSCLSVQGSARGAYCGASTRKYCMPVSRRF